MKSRSRSCSNGMSRRKSRSRSRSVVKNIRSNSRSYNRNNSCITDDTTNGRKRISRRSRSIVKNNRSRSRSYISNSSSITNNRRIRKRSRSVEKNNRSRSRSYVSNCSSSSTSITNNTKRRRSRSVLKNDRSRSRSCNSNGSITNNNIRINSYGSSSTASLNRDIEFRNTNRKYKNESRVGEKRTIFGKNARNCTAKNSVSGPLISDPLQLSTLKIQTSNESSERIVSIVEDTNAIYKNLVIVPKIIKKLPKIRKLNRSLLHNDIGCSSIPGSSNNNINMFKKINHENYVRKEIGKDEKEKEEGRILYKEDYDYNNYYNDDNNITNNDNSNRRNLSNNSTQFDNGENKEYYGEEDEKYSSNNIQVSDLPASKKVYDDKNNVTHIRRFNMNSGNNIISNPNGIKYNNEHDDYTRNIDFKNKRCSNHFNLEFCKNIKEKELSINMFKYIFSDLVDEKCLLNNNVKTFFVDVEYDKYRDDGRPTVIISYGSKSVKITSSEMFENKIEYKNDIICTIIRFIIFNCEEQLPIIYFNNEMILMRSKFLFEPSTTHKCSFGKCKNQPIVLIKTVKKLYCVNHARLRINSNNIQDCALYYPYIVFNDLYTSKINEENLTFFNVKILRLPEVFKKYRFGEDFNMFDLEKYLIGRGKDDTAFSDATYRWRYNWLVITTCFFKSSTDLRKLSRKIKINRYKEALSFTLPPNERLILNADLDDYNYQPLAPRNNWMMYNNNNGIHQQNHQHQQVMLNHHHHPPMNNIHQNNINDNNLRYRTMVNTLASLRKLLSYWQTFFARDFYVKKY